MLVLLEVSHISTYDHGAQLVIIRFFVTTLTKTLLLRLTETACFGDPSMFLNSSRRCVAGCKPVFELYRLFFFLFSGLGL